MAKLKYKGFTIQKQNGKLYSFQDSTYTIIIEKLVDITITIGTDEETGDPITTTFKQVEERQRYSFPATRDVDGVNTKLTKAYVLQQIKKGIDDRIATNAERTAFLLAETEDPTIKTALTNLDT